MYCKNCGAKIAENDKFCRNCGAPAKYALGRVEKEKAFWRHGWFTILMLFMCFPVGVILVFINHPGIVKTFFMFILGLVTLAIVGIALDSNSSDVVESVPYKSEQSIEQPNPSVDNKGNGVIVKDEEQRTTAESKVINEVVGLPDQMFFGYKLYDFKVAYDKAENKLQKSAVKNRQAKFLKNYFPDSKFENWRGVVKEIGSVDNGKFASIEIECTVDKMAFNMATEKYNVKLAGKQTLIDSDSKLYNEIFNLKKGDRVEFSAKVIPNKESGLYLDNWYSEEASVKSPEFIVQFKEIRKVNSN